MIDLTGRANQQPARVIIARQRPGEVVRLLEAIPPRRIFRLMAETIPLDRLVVS